MNRDLTLVSLALMIWGVGEGMFLFFEPLYLQQLGASPVAIGGILGVVGISMTVAHLPAGYLADRFGRRPLLIIAWFLGLISTWIMALSTELPLFVFGIVLYGLTSFVVVPLYSYVTAGRGSWSVGRAITLISAAFNIGAILGPLLGGWIGDHLGLHRSFFFAAILFMFSTAIILFIRPQPVEPANPETRSFGLRELFSPRYMQYLVVIFIAMFCMYLPQPLSQNYLQNQHGISLTGIGQLISARSVGVVVLNLTLGTLNARTGFLFSQVAMSAFSFLLWRGTGMPAFALGYFLLGSYQTAHSLAAAQGRTLVHSGNMGLAYGGIETVIALAIILAPPLAGYLYTLKPTLMYSTSLVLIGLAFLTTLVFSPLRSEEIL